MSETTLIVYQGPLPSLVDRTVSISSDYSTNLNYGFVIVADSPITSPINFTQLSSTSIHANQDIGPASFVVNGYTVTVNILKSVNFFTVPSISRPYGLGKTFTPVLNYPLEYFSFSVLNSAIVQHQGSGVFLIKRTGSTIITITHLATLQTENQVTTISPNNFSLTIDAPTSYTTVPGQNIIPVSFINPVTSDTSYSISPSFASATINPPTGIQISASGAIVVQNAGIYDISYSLTALYHNTYIANHTINITKYEPVLAVDNLNLRFGDLVDISASVDTGQEIKFSFVNPELIGLSNAIYSYSTFPETYAQNVGVVTISAFVESTGLYSYRDATAVINISQGIVDYNLTLNGIPLSDSTINTINFGQGPWTISGGTYSILSIDPAITYTLINNVLTIDNVAAPDFYGQTGPEIEIYTSRTSAELEFIEKTYQIRVNRIDDTISGQLPSLYYFNDVTSTVQKEFITISASTGFTAQIVSGPASISISGTQGVLITYTGVGIVDISIQTLARDGYDQARILGSIDVQRKDRGYFVLGTTISGQIADASGIFTLEVTGSLDDDCFQPVEGSVEFGIISNPVDISSMLPGLFIDSMGRTHSRLVFNDRAVGGGEAYNEAGFPIGIISVSGDLSGYSYEMQKNMKNDIVQPIAVKGIVSNTGELIFRPVLPSEMSEYYPLVYGKEMTAEFDVTAVFLAGDEISLEYEIPGAGPAIYTYELDIDIFETRGEE